MALRWCTAGMVEAGTQFRRVNGHCTCDPYATRWNGSPKPSVQPVMTRPSTPPDEHRPPPTFHGSRDILAATFDALRDEQQHQGNVLHHDLRSTVRVRRALTVLVVPGVVEGDDGVWRMRPSICASRRRLDRKSGSSANLLRRALIATQRPVRVSRPTRLSASRRVR
jgi:hypothetical protein